MKVNLKTSDQYQHYQEQIKRLGSGIQGNIEIVMLSENKRDTFSTRQFFIENFTTHYGLDGR